MKNKIIAVDFDGTLCENKWPDIGSPNKEIFSYLKDQRDKGAKIILWTCRTKELLADAVNWCKYYFDFEFDEVNRNAPEIIDLYGEDGRKIFADEYIDDKAVTKFALPFTFKNEEAE